MRKTLIYLIILAILGYGIWFFLIRTSSSPYSKAEAGFTIKDTASIGKLYLVANDGESILAERTDSGWMVNKKYRALPATLNTLLTTLCQQAPLYPVTKNAYDNVIKNLSTDGIKVEVYDRTGKKMAVFYVGGTAINSTGTNMLMDGSSRPFVVQVQGFNGYLTPRYSTKLKDWRDRTIFNVPASDIKSVSVQYVDKPINSFVISKDKDSVTVTVNEQYAKYAKVLNSRRAHIYLKYFTDINSEGFLNGVDHMDSIIIHSHKHSTIDVEDIHGQTSHLDVYWLDINKRSKNLDVPNPEVPNQYDADRLIAILQNTHDTILIQQLTFKNIYHKGFEFYEGDLTPDQLQPLDKPQKNVIYHKKG